MAHPLGGPEHRSGCLPYRLLLVLLQQIHIQMAVLLEPGLVTLDGEGEDQP